ncbi:MAG: hypothetical protein AB7F09_26765 [Parvibaculaceae bacterium]
MTLVEEGLIAMRGCWRLLRRDPGAFDDFNFSIEGFWRSFAMVVPVVVLAYPLFVSDHRFGLELAEAGDSPPELRLGTSYFYLLSGVVAWPLVAALLAWLLGVAPNYVRYMIIYNWMAVPTLTLAVIPHLLHLAGSAIFLPLVLAQGVFIALLYVSWYVARVGLATTAPVAFAFLLADFALTYGLDALIR